MRKEKAKLLKDYGDPVTMKEFRSDLNAFEKAVREDCAKMAEGPELNWKGYEIAAAIRGKR